MYRLWCLKGFRIRLSALCYFLGISLIFWFEFGFYHLSRILSDLALKKTFFTVRFINIFKDKLEILLNKSYTWGEKEPLGNPRKAHRLNRRLNDFKVRRRRSMQFFYHSRLFFQSIYIVFCIYLIFYLK